MMSFLGALFVVLGLIAAGYHVARRFQGRVEGGKPVLQVLSRTAIAHRQGIALVRMGERIVAVSLGDGGVRKIMEFSPEESAEFSATLGGVSPALSLQFRSVLQASREALGQGVRA